MEDTLYTQGKQILKWGRLGMSYIHMTMNSKNKLEKEIIIICYEI